MSLYYFLWFIIISGCLAFLMGCLCAVCEILLITGIVPYTPGDIEGIESSNDFKNELCWTVTEILMSCVLIGTSYYLLNLWYA